MGICQMTSVFAVNLAKPENALLFHIAKLRNLLEFRNQIILHYLTLFKV